MLFSLLSHERRAGSKLKFWVAPNHKKQFNDLWKKCCEGSRSVSKFILTCIFIFIRNLYHNFSFKKVQKKNYQIIKWSVFRYIIMKKWDKKLCFLLVITYDTKSENLAWSNSRLNFSLVIIFCMIVYSLFLVEVSTLCYVTQNRKLLRKLRVLISIAQRTPNVWNTPVGLFIVLF